MPLASPPTCRALLLLLSGVIWLPTVTAQSIPTVVDRDSKLETLSTDFVMADGPCWDGSSLIIPDVKGEKLYRFVDKEEHDVQTLLPDAGRISATFFNHGRIFLSDNANGEIAFLDGRKKVTVASFTALNAGEKKPYRPNDLVVDNHGGIYVTFTPQSNVIYVDSDGELSVAVEKIETPNGITLSPDGSTLYVSSFVPKKIWAYDITGPGKTGNGREIASMDDGPNRGADGMAIDRAGNIYCAGPTDIWIWTPSGKLIDKIACPTKPINCAFGDRHLKSLYITGPGALYRQRMKISGRSPTPVSLNLKPASKFGAKQNESAPDTKTPQRFEGAHGRRLCQYGDRKLLADIIVPKTASSTERLPALVVVHGGGWHNGDKTKFRALSTKLASRGYVVAAIEYRLADEAAFPAAMHDCAAAVRYLRANADKYHIQRGKIGAIGGSAGGHLVGLMASGGGNPKLQGDGGHADRSSRIQAAIVMAGPLEMLTGSVAERSRSGEGKSNANSWLRSTVDEKPDLYRLADAHAQIDEHTCPILFLVGEHDNPSRNQPSRDKLKSLGIETGVKIYKDAKHGCWNRLPWLDEMVVDMDAFMTKRLR